MSLFTDNTFQSFWGVPSGFALSADILQEQVSRLFPGLPEPRPMNWEGLAGLALGEEQFGPEHFRLKGMRQRYYQLRPFLPARVRTLLHRIAGSRQSNNTQTEWPVEDRLVRFLFDSMRAAMQAQRKAALEYVHFWPHGKRFAFVITHDIESAAGQSFARRLADLDEKYGFRSAFNFVPKEYPIDIQLIAELRQRGFEIGAHGWKHDGKLFSSRAGFEKQSQFINRFMDEYGAVGFRSPLTHRNPEWMQALEIEYDSSFFDTDPFEPIPGGTMSIWPFQMGRFVELPYTLAQDHTLMSTLGEKSPRLWLEKVEFIRKYCGMALVNVHPDYQRNPVYFAIYEEFLLKMSQRSDYWHALPRDVARWWKKRAQLHPQEINGDLHTKLPGATIGTIRLLEDITNIEIHPNEVLG
jgi:peptidoglycan/xylan/chitin deacetylase (PgdA/CDA1 family)